MLRTKSILSDYGRIDTKSKAFGLKMPCLDHVIIEWVLVLVENWWRPNWGEIGKLTIKLILEG